MKFKIRIASPKQKMSCPRATQDLKYNTEMRDKAIEAKHIQYGPMKLLVLMTYNVKATR